MVKALRFDCCKGQFCSAGSKAIFLFDFEELEPAYNSVVIVTYGRGTAYVVTVEQSSVKNFSDPLTTTINQAAAGFTITPVKIELRYMRITVTGAGAGEFKVCRVLRSCCEDDSVMDDLMALLTQIYNAIDTLEVSVGHISIEADQINLNTDDLEALIASMAALISSDIGTVNLNLNLVQSKQDAANVLLTSLVSGIQDYNTLISKNGDAAYLAGDANAVKTVTLAMTAPGLIAKIAVMRTAVAGTVHTGMTVRVYENSVAQANLVYENTGIVVAAGVTTVLNTVPIAYIPHTDNSLIVQLTPTGGDGTTACTYNCKIITQKMRV
jgi:hypothetical protein